MPRQSRRLQGNVVYHFFNRRTDKQCLFPSRDAYADFLTVLRRGKERYTLRLHAYCIMSTHWHLAASAEVPQMLNRYLRWVTTTHAVRFRFQTKTRGHGHVYQDRYKANPVETSVDYTRLIKYIEANPIAAGLVVRAEDYTWSSLRERVAGKAGLIEPGPWQLPERWTEIVNAVDFRTEFEPSLLGQLSSFRPPRQAFPEFS